MRNLFENFANFSLLYFIFSALNLYCSSRKIRYNGYNSHIWERPEPYPLSPPPHGNGFHSMHPQPSVSPLQPALMVDVSQVSTVQFFGIRTRSASITFVNNFQVLTNEWSWLLISLWVDKSYINFFKILCFFVQLIF